MYKILVVDDNRFTREGTAAFIHSSFGDAVQVITGTDGLNALNQALIDPPDILLTDLRMPFMNGMELAEKLHSFLPEIKIIFFSSYSDKAYLKAAIKLQAVSYIDKPLDNSELFDTLRSCIASLDERSHLKRELLSYKDGFTDLILKLWGRTLCRKNTDIAPFRIHFENLGLDSLLTCAYRCVFLSIPVSDSQAKEFLPKNVSFLSFTREDDLNAAFLYTDDASALSEEALLEPLTSLCKCAEKLRIGAGVRAEDYQGAYYSFETALTARERLFFEKQPVFFLKENREDMTCPSADKFASELLHRMEDEITVRKRQPSDALREALQCLSETRSETAVRLFTASLPDYLLDYSRNNFYDLHERMDCTAMTEALGSCCSMDELGTLVLSWAKSFTDPADDEHRLVREVTAFIAAHYMEANLSIGTIATHVGYSPTHLSMMFKQYTGTTIKQQITDIRMEHVKKELRDGTQSLETIAAFCGYQNARYLCHVFKKYTGITPARFREK